MLRRSFLQKSVTTSAVLAVSGSKLIGANDNIRMAVIGLNGKGAQHVELFRRTPGVQVAALCDPDSAILEREAQKFRDRNEPVSLYKDIRKLLDDKSIDAVIIATPNNWHCLAGIWACQAGKDAYVEKPLSYNIWEGRKLVEAARKYNRIVQAGTQRRSDEGIMAIDEYLQKGNLGKIRYVHGICYRERESIGKVDGPQPIPPNVDYDLWCGPAAKGPLMRKNLHYDWHWVWPTGNGEIGNNGIHSLDVCRWLLHQKQIAPRVISLGGRFGYKDDGETPNTQIAILDYKPAPILYEVRGLYRRAGEKILDNAKGIRFGEIIYCEGGSVAGDFAYDREGKKIRQFGRDEGANHHLNFIAALRSRNRRDLHADVEECHLSTALCHMANISFRLGKEAGRAEIAKSLASMPAAVEVFESFQEHLLQNGVNINETPRLLGPWLEMDSSREEFTGEWAEQANRFLTREYRPPFVVPEKV
jgi:predicted dehydrogenase